MATEKFVLTIEVELEKGSVADRKAAVELLVENVRQLGGHNVAKKVSGTIYCDRTGRDCGIARYEDGQLHKSVWPSSENKYEL